jgi:ADP-dependent NAD(P)H-hydrate dehydratase / NAD(P)H-hydrate epimerase
MKIVTAEQMREIDAECIRRGTPVSVLMENAGKAVAAETRTCLGALEGQHILCLVGAGNNGGDGLVAARYLREQGAHIAAYICAPRPADDKNYALAREKGVTCVEAARDIGLKQFDEFAAGATCVIDALLGTGKIRSLEGVYKAVLERINRERQKRHLLIVAVDLPSGMDADTGAVDPACPYADLTVTLAFPKTGLFSFPGAERVGRLKIADIGIPESLADAIPLELMTDAWAAAALPPRPLSANKGTFGRVLVGAGSINYIGAAYLACSGALRVGAGLVTLATAASLQPVLAAKLTEATYLPLPESRPGIASVEGASVIYRQSGQYNTLLLGCGLGQNAATVEFASSLLLKPGLPGLVLDADALNILARLPNWWQSLASDAVLTPHPGEMSRLSGLSIDEVQADRPGIARRFAAAWQKTVVLKGAYTVIAAPDGRGRVSPFANPGLASAGTGDVLSGCIAGLAAQGLPLFEAACLGVYLHGLAGDMVRDRLGDTGMLASDLLPVLPLAIKRLKNLSRGES